MKSLPVVVMPSYIEHTSLSGEPLLQIGEHMVTYHINFRNEESGWRVAQLITLSVAVSVDGGAVCNSIPHICGVIIQPAAEVVFLHPDTIREVVRHGFSLISHPTVQLDEVQDVVSIYTNVVPGNEKVH